MILSKSAEYALRVVVFIATNPSSDKFSSIELAEKIEIPSSYGSKILRKLVKAGILSGTRGRSGGFVLLKPLSQIFFSDILSAADFDFNKSHCVFGYSKCNSSSPCVLHYRWKEINESFNQWASQTNLNSVIEDIKTKSALAKYRSLLSE